MKMKAQFAFLFIIIIAAGSLAPPAQAVKLTTMPSVGQIWHRNDSTETYASSYFGGATGCMKLRGLEDENLVEGYSVNGLTNAKTRKGSFNFPKDQNRRFDFKGYFMLKILSGSVRVMEVRGEGGGCPNRLNLR